MSSGAPDSRAAALAPFIPSISTGSLGVRPSPSIVDFDDETLPSGFPTANAAGSGDAETLPSSIVRGTATATPGRTASKSSPDTATSNASASDGDAKCLDIDNVVLRFDTIEDALGDGLMGRESLKVENDDFATIKSGAHPKAWVKSLMEAFGRDYLAEPEDASKRAPKQKEWFTRWQKQAHVSVLTIFEAKGMSHLEKSCWHLFDSVIKAHELGVIHTANHWSPSSIKCSKRLAFIVSIIEKYALVRVDVLRSWLVDEIAANPEAFIKRKLTNCWNNEHRAVNNAETKARKQASGNSAGKKRAMRKIASIDGQISPSAQDDIVTPVPGKKARQSYAADEAQNSAKTDDISKRKRSSTGTISANPQSDGNDESLSNNSPLNLKSTVTIDTNNDETVGPGLGGKK